MKSRNRSYIVAAALIATCFSYSVAAAGGNGWGWAKPLNKRMGAFYTSNRNANFSRSNHRTKSYHTYRQQVTQPTIRYAQPLPVVRSAPVVTNGVAVHTTVPAGRTGVIVQPPTTKVTPTTPQHVAPRNAASPHAAPIAQPTPTQQPQSKMIPGAGALPHRSTTNQFWQ